MKHRRFLPGQRVRAALWVSLLWLAGCEFSAAKDEAVTNQCEVDDDCPGAVCDTDLQICVATESEPLRIVIQVVTSSDPTAATGSTHFLEEMSVAAALERDLTLAPTLGVFGRVRYAGLSSLVPHATDAEGVIAARVKFRLVSGVTGAPSTEQEVSTVPTPVQAQDEMPADYAVRLVSGETYEVTVEPTGELAAVLPPLRRRVTVPDGGQFARLDLDYPETFRSLMATLVTRDAADPTMQTGVDGVHVAAVAIDSGAVISNTVVTEVDEAGDTLPFELRITGEDNYMIRVWATAESSAFPSVLIDPAGFFPAAGEDFTRILVPTLGRVQYIGTVEAQTPAGTVAVAGAAVSFVAEDVLDNATNVGGSYRTTVTTDDAGTFVAEVLPGTYEVVVTPPSSVVVNNTEVQTSLGMLVEEVVVSDLNRDDALRGQVFALPSRTVLGGQVEAIDGRLMTGVTVQADPLRVMGPGLPPAARYNRAGSSLTDVEGKFALPLDAGIFDVSIRPPAGSLFAWRVQTDLTVSDDAPVEAEAVVLNAPVPMRGRVLSSAPDGTMATVPGADILAWAIVDTERGPSRPVLVARTESREDGSYILALPPAIE